MSNSTDILYVIPRPEIGGAERLLLTLLRGLDRSRFSPHLICLDGSGSLLSDFEEVTESVHILQRSRPVDPKTLGALVRLMREIRPALVHTYLYIANLYGGWGARLAGVPKLVVSQFGLGIDPQRGRLRSLRMRALNLFIGQFSDRLLVNAETVARHMWLAGYRPEDTRVVYNGVDVSKRASESRRDVVRRELNVRDDEILLGTLSRIDPKKDLGTMLRAVALAARTCPNIRLLILAGGFSEYLRELRDLAQKLGISEKVHFLDFHPDPLTILSTCHISLLSSVTEGLPNAILESMLLSKPVVSTNVGGIPEIIENGVDGWLVPPRNPDLLAKRIVDLIHNPGRAIQMGAAGRRKAMRHFTADAMIRNTQSVYEELLFPPSSRSGTTPTPSDLVSLDTPLFTAAKSPAANRKVLESSDSAVMVT